MLHSVACLKLQECTDHAVRLADHLKVRPNTFVMLQCLHVVRHIHAALVRLNIDVQDQLLQQFELLPILVHTYQFLQHVLGDVLAAELACNYGRAKMRNEFVFEVLLNKKPVNVAE